MNTTRSATVTAVTKQLHWQSNYISKVITLAKRFEPAVRLYQSFVKHHIGLHYLPESG